MSETIVKSPSFRTVHTGRLVLLNNKHLAVVVEIIDNKRVLIDSVDPVVPRQAISLDKVVLTPVVLPGLTRGARTATVAKKWKASNVDAQWAKSGWAKKLASRERRRELTDFERFQVLVLKKQRRYATKKALAKA
ncbi:60S ribosomal protein eL14 [Lodderomyces beijingensis]|uniref:Large ribosomal subunit protein eL14 domain-containing protein n=1 Tax=Lodderomyces beijingensis TaxID=1775926 RepID=A0ABP0ZFE8_9ASCO